MRTQEEIVMRIRNLEDELKESDKEPVKFIQFRHELRIRIGELKWVLHNDIIMGGLIS
jgi:hypothetical protein